VEKFAADADWSRAYPEINDFEEQLSRNGGIVIKYWLQISKEEQLARFKAREQTAHKQFKITPEDWRNRKKWSAYQSAAAEMIERTSTGIAPWTLVPANDKYHARALVLKAMCERIERAL
jgi:polyphosphate kinase 2 (PPK2 family)